MTPKRTTSRQRFIIARTKAILALSEFGGGPDQYGRYLRLREALKEADDAARTYNYQRGRTWR